MKDKRCSFVLAAAFWILTSVCEAQEWKVYAAYSNHTQAVMAGSVVYTVCDGGLFSYDTDDQFVATYDKASSLNDNGIYSIAPYGSSLVILYNNGNIDLLNSSGSVYNMPELKNKALDDKTLNELRVFGSEATISTNSGLVIVNLKDRTFSVLYDLGDKIESCIIKKDTIYAKTPSAVMIGDRDLNLQDTSNWRKKNAQDIKSEIDFDTYSKEESATNAHNLKIVEKINPEGPKKNYFYKMHFDTGNRLLVAGGCFNYPELNRDGTIMMYENGKWSAFDDVKPKQENKLEWYYSNVTDVVQDPDDDSHFFASCACSGLYEFKNGSMVNHYSYKKNSPLQTILPGNSNEDYYVRITGLAFDADKNLWMLNNECDTIVRIMKPDKKWKAYYYPEIDGYQTFDQVMFDERGWAWINCRRTTAGGNHAGVLVINTGGTIDAVKDDKHVFIQTLVNQDGKSYTEKLSEMNCIVEDLNGAIWVGTNQGPFMIEDPTSVFSPDFRYTQVKVPRNDGSDLADYLLNEVAIKCIAIDGGNRKWFGTVSNGVYLTNADGTEIIHHFTKDNSPLISDEIYTIAIDGRTGEVLIGTRDGLCSYMSDATDPVEKFDEDLVKVYPNPIRPEYSGDIKITGLMNSSHVKIVSANGRLVNKGASIGGSYIWNGRLANGKKANSGIYYILATDEKGDEGVAGKFVIIN